ncbi:MAG TPA: thiamine-phosphate kinase [Dermatophilaceae bacterium]|nr:thiamine-phosphate kinase [Dermatophilaceae bacterium]
MPGPVLGDLSEEQVLAAVLPGFRSGADVLVPPGDDAAVLRVASGSVVATTDSMVRGRDWHDAWSSGHDVGVKVVAQNVADVAAMGAVATALLVALAADPATPLAWVADLTAGIAAAAEDAGASVVGGDLSSAPDGLVVVAVTALGDLQGRSPVLRSGARPGDVVAVCGSLGWSGGGLAVLQGRARPGCAEPAREALTAYHRAPRPPWEAGPEAARAGATAMVDVSDGLVRDVGRVAAASGVTVALSAAALRERFAGGPLLEVLGADEAWRQVLGGGEEHALVATFPAGAAPEGGTRPWQVVGEVLAAPAGAPRVTVDGAVPPVTGWDHFAR